MKKIQKHGTLACPLTNILSHQAKQGKTKTMWKNV